MRRRESSSMSIGIHARRANAARKRAKSLCVMRSAKKRLAEGCCKRCGKLRPPTLALYCRACADKWNAYQRAYQRGEATPDHQASKQAKTPPMPYRGWANAIRNHDSFAYFCSRQSNRLRQLFARQNISHDKERRTSRGEWRERHERFRLCDFEITRRGNCQGAFK